MRCPSCSSENPEGTKFCGNCGAPLHNRCAKCGAENPPPFKFCGECGAPLQAGSSSSGRAEAGLRQSPSGERRHLTVLFCDLVGSTQIASQLDPEEWRDTVAGYHRAAADAITRFGGQVAKFLGDGVMAFFGYPEAHDNDAERAARAGLAILDAVPKLIEHPEHPMLVARVGIDSGSVVVGVGASKDADVFGDAPNIAARVQEAAAPGTVLVTEETHRLISGLFVVEAHGAQVLKGIERAVQLYRVTQPTGARGRLEAAAAMHGLTPFVGREEELRLLMSRWERVLEGEGQVALIVGEAGIGKSRLVQRFREQIVGSPHAWIEAGAAPFYQNAPFYPVSEVLLQLLWEQGLERFGDYLSELQTEEKKDDHRSGRRGDRPTEEQLAQLQSGLELAGLKASEAIPLIAPLLDLPSPSTYPPSPVSPEQQRRRLLATLVDWILGVARGQPIAIAIEDLHWADPSTLELVQLLVEQGARARLLLLFTARPEFRVQWLLRAHHTQITLNRLSARNVRKMVQEVAASTALPEETIAVVADRTGGIPLFVEELTRAVLESGTAQLTGREIPVTLHDSLMARLDRLGPAKEVIQVGAVIGSEFSYDMLHAICRAPENDLQQSLRTLADAELLYVRGIAPEATYQFKHALIRDAAYEALFKSRRKELHGLVARTLNEKFLARKENHPEILARHWTEAGEIKPAIAEWSRAGDSAQARNAFKEAQESYEQALALLSLLPESPERDLRELELRQSVVRMLQMTRAYSAPETIAAIKRAAALAERSGKLTQMVTLMVSRNYTVLVSGDLNGARTLADQALDLATRSGCSTDLALVHIVQTHNHYWRGDLLGVEKHFTAALALLTAPELGQLPGAAVLAFGYASWNAWLIGKADVARERVTQMVARASANNPYDLAISVAFAAELRAYLREYEESEALAARALELSEKNRFPQIAAYSRCELGHARARLGGATEGIALIRKGIEALLEIDARMGIALWTTYLAAAQEREGAILDALETVEQALRANPEELAYRPETLRLRAYLLLKEGPTELAEAGFRESIALAQKMSAKAWELRTATSLARLLLQQGKVEEARRLLSEIYNWFTEGFDTADLKDAKALLDELGA